jgi:bacterioferritin
MDLAEFRAGHPYPKPEVAAKNQTYARLMLNNCADRDSEMSSVALYFYDCVVTKDTPLLSDAFAQITRAEEEHLRLFAELAFLSGADPRLWEVLSLPQGRTMRYWSAARLPYALNQKIMLQNAMALERAAVRKYERQLQEIKDEGILTVLRRVLLDEHLHLNLFRALLEELQGGRQLTG